MELLTDTQYQLGLGMLAADRRSGLTPAQRVTAIWLLEHDKPISDWWQRKIEAYLETRQAKQQPPRDEAYMPEPEEA